jgi:prepilin-type N-terminal cleavage/methylation domain-containing protein
MKPVSQRNQAAGFTLVEMLVSVAVLVLIMTFIAQMMNSATISTTLSGAHVDTDAEARLIFDRMQDDFSRMSHRTDVDFAFEKQPDYTGLNISGTGTASSGTGAEMFFYSEAPAYAAASGTYPSTVALIGYTVNITGGSAGTASNYIPAYSLERLSKGLSLSPSSTGGGGNEASYMLFLSSPNQVSLPIAATGLLNSESQVIGTNGEAPLDTTDYDLLSPEVLRMDFVFQVKDLTNPNHVSTVYSNYPCAFFQSGAANMETISNSPPSTAAVTGPHPAVGDRWYDASTNRTYLCANLISTTVSSGTPQTYAIWKPNGLADVDAIVVTIAIIDQKSRKQLQAINALDYIPNQLEAPVEGYLNPKISGGNASDAPQLTADLWQSQLNDMIAAASGPSPNSTVPINILSQVRIYQRFFYLNNN